MSSLGFDVNDTIFLYEQNLRIGATWVFWILHAWGFKHVFVLDGGITAWKDAGYEVGPGYSLFEKVSWILPSEISLDRTKLVYLDELV